ncbi:glycoside hydrolase family 2 protein [Abyssalbus ytuae]|uniref:Glycoside hydrolase family 2 protein n=1 Tax=Abyssalbus ytuae TaxID=2926907 RepID=A0A9E7CZR7_9FLAO|nr:glycoside hydrolase family 2 TIM barrel-domain containing protein [Abyssalbus ytuae]UOB17800.1 glycoside hydrolase family 2 protein [Abyssalbus ytuae]
MNMLQIFKLTITLYFFGFPCVLVSQDTNLAREKMLLNENWLYLENNSINVEEVRNETEYWQPINLPHTWNNEDTMDSEPGYRRNAGWYKKNISCLDLSKNKRKILYFEGANITTKVYVNGEEAGNHVGGYVGFKIDISDYLEKGDNEILIRVDNSYNPEIIPSQKSDFFIYGGITRDVWLITLPVLHLGEPKISTPEVSEKEASLKITTQIKNLDSKRGLFFKAVLKAPFSNKIIREKTIRVTKPITTVIFKNIKNPSLWDIDTPNLYSVELSLVQNGNKVDKVSEKIGFRWFEFKKNGPFYLNGKRLLLRGTHRHEEHAGVGAAMSNKQHYADIKLIKDMGANFVRLAHYPQDPEVYKACDELGILVWDELPWCRGGIGNDTWKKNTKNLLKEMILQNYNHPSIIIWSLGNEIYWLPDFEGGDEVIKINPFLKELNQIARELDPGRKTAIRKYYEGSDIVDVFSPSIWSGWYSGSYKNYQKAIDLYKKKYDYFIHAEYGGSSHFGRHTEIPVTGEGIINSQGWEEEIVQTKVDNIAKVGDWSENYIVDLFDWHLRVSETDSTFAGNIQWAMKDFGTPLRPENEIPYINQKGLTDRSGKPKDAYYVFKSYWSKDPFVYIESHTWKERQGPKNLPRIISVYSNCSSVELFHNGKSLGKKEKDITQFPASGLNWEVNFKDGKNKLLAVAGNKEGQQISDTLNINYRHTINGKPTQLSLSYKKLSNGNLLITAKALDVKGLSCLDYEKRVYFQCLSGGRLLKNQGTPTGSDIISMANGTASVELIPDKNSSSINVTVLNQDFKGVYLKIVQ